MLWESEQLKKKLESAKENDGPVEENVIPDQLDSLVGDVKTKLASLEEVTKLAKAYFAQDNSKAGGAVKLSDILIEMNKLGFGEIVSRANKISQQIDDLDKQDLASKE